MSGSCGGCAGGVVTRRRDRSRRLSVGISSTRVSRLSQASLAAGRRSGVSIAVPDLHAAPVRSPALPVGRHARCCAHGSWLVFAPFRFFIFYCGIHVLHAHCCEEGFPSQHSNRQRACRRAGSTRHAGPEHTAGRRQHRRLGHQRVTLAVTLAAQRRSPGKSCAPQTADDLDQAAAVTAATVPIWAASSA